jgi:phosphocarrier protein HPr
MIGQHLTRRVVVSRREGLHLRRAAALSELARRFPCETHVSFGKQQADAKSVLDLLCLGAGPGEELFLEADGPESRQALDSLSALVAGSEQEAPAMRSSAARAQTVPRGERDGDRRRLGQPPVAGLSVSDPSIIPPNSESTPSSGRSLVGPA